MDKMTINSLCMNILRSANSIVINGEENAAQIIGICRAARQIAAELTKTGDAQCGGED